MPYTEDPAELEGIDVAIVGADMVEVIPTEAAGDITALAGERIVREIVTGIALRRRQRRR